MNRTIQEIQHEKIIAIVRGVKGEKLIRLCQALYDGGIRLVECTYDASQTVSDEETAENIRQMADEFDGMMTVGAGTVLTEKQVLLTKNAGGKFIISPDVNTDVIQATKREGLVSIRWRAGVGLQALMRCRFCKALSRKLSWRIGLHQSDFRTAFPCKTSGSWRCPHG